MYGVWYHLCSILTSLSYSIFWFSEINHFWVIFPLFMLTFSLNFPLRSDPHPGLKTILGHFRDLCPRPVGGLSHLRHGGGGGKMTPRLTRKLGKLEGRVIRRSKALSGPVRSHFGHFSLRWILRSAEVIKCQIFEKWCFFRNDSHYLGNYNSYAKSKKAKDNFWNALSLRCRQISPKINRLSVRGHERSKTAFLSETVFRR